MRFLTGRQNVHHIPVDELYKRLADERHESSVLTSLASSSNEHTSIKRNTDNWVRTWVDMSYSVEHEDGKRVALRAITDTGKLIWMVETLGRKYAYHADANKVEEAFAQAEQARVARRGIARQWRDVKVLRRRVLLGSVSLVTTLEDARNAGLCELGIQGFLNRIGYTGATNVSGRLLMLLSFIDRQIAYAVYAGYLRMKQNDQCVGMTDSISLRQ